MNASFSGVTRGNWTKESKHVCEFLGSVTRLEPTASRGELWFACTGVRTGGRAHSSPLLYVVRIKESTTCVQVLLSTMMLGFVYDG